MDERGEVLNMSIEKRLWDIPAELKEYHNIYYDAESNQYYMGGHREEYGIIHPQWINFPSDVIITTFHEDEKIVSLIFSGCEVTLFPLSTMTHISKGL